MAVEVAAERHLFLPPPKDTDFSPTTEPFRYCTLHDTESLWWISVFSLFCNRPEEVSADFDLEKQKADARTLFPLQLHIHRQNAFQTSSMFKEMIPHLPVQLHKIAEALDRMRRRLVMAYWTAEHEGGLDPSEFGKLHEFFEKLLMDVVPHCKDIQLHLGLNSESKRRARTDLEGPNSSKKTRI